VSREGRGLRPDDFPVRRTVTTRWSDNDSYGHLNNAVYYEIYDSVINAWLGEATGIATPDLPALGVVAASGCEYFGEVSFPEPVTVGLAVTRIGRSSVTYRLGVFPCGAGDLGDIAALGTWTHVYVDPDTRRPVPIPDVVLEAIRPVVVS